MLTEYRALRDESLKRMDHRITLLVSSLTISGLILGVGAERQSGTLLLVTPIMTVLFGLLVLYHTKAIPDIARYLLVHVEQPFEDSYPGSLGWHTRPHWRRHRFREILSIFHLPIMLTVVVPAAVAFALAFQYDGSLGVKFLSPCWIAFFRVLRCSVLSANSPIAGRETDVTRAFGRARMVGVDDYLAINRRNWDERVPIHAAAGSRYDLDLFRSDPAHLSRVVSFDRPRLGDVTGARGLHLQCHIGTDTLSLARLGARMSGLDFSPPALDVARRLAADTGAEIDYREADAYDAVEVFGRGSFDLVYTGVGAICWLPRIDRWAEVVAGLLRPGGRLFIREGHPMLWALDETANPPVLRYPYFEPAEALVFDEPTSYAGDGTPLTNSVSHSFTHGLGEIVAALLANGMRLTRLDEHDSVPWEALPGLMTCDDAGEWRLTENPERLAASYTIEAVKEGSA